MTFETLVEVMTFVCARSPSSPGLRTRTEIETLQNEQFTTSFQSQFQINMLPPRDGIDSGFDWLCPPDILALFGEELVSELFAF